MSQPRSAVGHGAGQEARLRLQPGEDGSPLASTIAPPIGIVNGSGPDRAAAATDAADSPKLTRRNPHRIPPRHILVSESCRTYHPGVRQPPFQARQISLRYREVSAYLAATAQHQQGALSSLLPENDPMASDEPPRSPPGSASDGPPTLDGSREIGPYKLLSVLGEGGMGIVYLAEQRTPLRRRVALKVLRVGMDSPEALARFESERQALAVMDHPGIAKVFDSGVTPTDRPYFVMEVVHGTPITDYADTHRLGTAERVRLFIAVCSAVQHAHQKGVIHRDLKPSNVLVEVGDTGPRVRIIDFGIAKVAGLGFTDRTLLTRAGQMVGTPAYMSPEQAEMSGLDVDTRTDVYSLGVMLYELIVGTIPFDPSARPGHSIPHALRERDVPRPSTKLTSLGESLPTIARHRSTTPEALRRDLKGDLDWIILRAMEKDRTRRYETVNGLALDLQRHLDNEPVRARPPSVRYRAAKFIRRHRPVVIAAAVAVLAICGGAAAATVGFVQARAEEQRAQEAAATAEQVSEFLVDLFSVSDPGEARGSTITAREVLDRGAGRIEAELAGQPPVQASLMRVMGEVYRGLGLYDQAASLLERAVAIADGAPAVEAAERVRALRELGAVHSQQGRFDEAEAVLGRAHDILRAEGKSGTLEFADLIGTMGTLEIRRGRYRRAESLLLEALSTQERLLGPEDAEVARTLSNLAAVHLSEGAHVAAAPYLERALPILERTLGPDHPRVGATLSNLGAAYQFAGEYDRAEEAYRQARPILETALGPEHPQMGPILNNLGEIHWIRGEYTEAEELLVQALRVREASGGPDHPSLVSTLRVLGNLYRDQGRFQEAEPMYERALDISEASFDASDHRIQEVLQDFSRFLRAADRAEEAVSLEDRAARLGTEREGR
jgi:eukaryotic-like serine/threonine-protein kinase